MKLKQYVSDFVEDFNCSGIILCAAEEINFDELFLKLIHDDVYHMNRFEDVRSSRIFYIKYCDLFTVIDNEIKVLLEDAYTFKTLHQDENGFYVMVGGK